MEEKVGQHTILDPWVYGLLELMKHAEEYQQANGEFDRRIALIGYDNTIEVSINIYLQLHPTQRGGAPYAKEQVNKWLTSYHSLLDFFFEEFVETSGQIPPITKQIVIHYHNPRNDLYHKGKSLVPTERDLKGAREAALYIFSTEDEEDGSIHKYEISKSVNIRKEGVSLLRINARGTWQVEIEP